MELILAFLNLPIVYQIWFWLCVVGTVVIARFIIGVIKYLRYMNNNRIRAEEEEEEEKFTPRW